MLPPADHAAGVIVSDVKLYSSVAVELGGPPNAKAEV
jgi:hypothetical protein